MKKTQTLNTYEETKDKALRLLTFRAHSEKELADKLKHAGAAEENIEKTLDFCRRYNFVDDEKYALSKAKDLKNLKKFGRRRIAEELRAAGIAQEYIEESLLELENEEDDDVLYELIKRRLGGDPEKKSTDRVIRYFLYRGYEMREITSCIDRIKRENI